MSYRPQRSRAAESFDPKPWVNTAEVNPILVAYRKDEWPDNTAKASTWLTSLKLPPEPGWQPHHIEFARRVLQKLAALS